MANKVFNMAGGLHSAAAYSAFENAMFGSCVATASDFMATAGTGMNVSLSAGNGLISTGTGFARRIASDAVNTIAITAAASTARIDAIVAYIDNSVTPTTSVVDNTNDVLKFTAVAGTAAATPSAPSTATIQSAIGAGNPYMVLWEVTIPANATALTNATFTDKRNIATIASLKSELDAFKASLILTDFNSADSVGTVSNITWSTKDLTLAQSADGSTFKFYGRIYATNATGSSRSIPPVAIPGLSDLYGRATGLYLNSTPDSAFQISPAGVRRNSDSSKVLDVVNNQIAVGSDGQIYIFVTTNSSGISLAANTTANFFWFPSVYYNTNFGDSGGE